MKEKKTNAYLSIFMSLTLTLMMSLCLVLIEGVRQNTIRLEAECIVDIGMNSVLAEYHREVLDRYNLFLIDSSYGTELPSYYNTEEHLRGYLKKNLSVREELGILADKHFGRGIYMDLLGLSLADVKITGLSLITDNAGYNLQKQAVRAAESNIGISVIEEVLSWIEVVREYDLLDNRLSEEIGAVEQQLDALEGKQQLEDNSWVTVKIENPVEEIIDNRRKGLLNWVLDDTGTISAKSVDLSQYISARRKNQQINKGNIAAQEKLSLYERLLFQEYLFSYVGNYRESKTNSRLDYQIEYLLFGTEYDTENLKQTVMAVCGLREVANMICLMGDSGKREMISAAATVLSAAVLAPEAAPLLEGLILIGWSCLESIEDTRILLEGGRVPLLKDASSWNSSLENALGGGKGDASKNAKGLQYEDYLRLFMYFADLEEITYRFMDIVEMDIRKTKGNEYFRIDGCIDYLEIMAVVESEYDYEYGLRHAKGYR